jgi:hypothetical protein
VRRPPPTHPPTHPQKNTTAFRVGGPGSIAWLCHALLLPTRARLSKRVGELEKKGWRRLVRFCWGLCCREFLPGTQLPAPFVPHAVPASRNFATQQPRCTAFSAPHYTATRRMACAGSGLTNIKDKNLNLLLSHPLHSPGTHTCSLNHAQSCSIMLNHARCTHAARRAQEREQWGQPLCVSTE